MSSGGQTGTAVSYGQASLTSALLRPLIRQITKRDNVTDLTNDEIDVKIKESCREVSKRSLCLPSSTTGTLSASTNTITIPTDMIPSRAAIKQLYLSTTLLDPLTFDEWRAGYMTGWAYRDGTIYVCPTPDTAKAYTLYYRKYHPDSVASIILNDDFKMAIVYLSCKKIYDDYEQSEDKGIEYELKFENELAKYMPADADSLVSRIRSFRG
jgi:hypothetical protein